ncbi:MAG: hypothetical protein L0Y66_10920 [Myxococcaceae bacterium]|nr:hypothetical protein [Myxococcaceae bacterium]
MSPPSPPRSLPGGIRLAAVVAAVLAGCVWLKASWELTDVLVTERERINAPVSQAEQVLLDAATKFNGERDQVLGPSREVRALVLGALSLTCGLVLTAALLLLRPGVMPRAGLGRMLSRMAIVTALLRAADGAQSFALDRGLREAYARLAEANLDFVTRLLELSAPMPPDERAAFVARAVGISTWGGLVMTVLVAGGLLALGQFFGSTRVREAVALRDRFLEG